MSFQPKWAKTEPPLIEYLLDQISLSGDGFRGPLGSALLHSALPVEVDEVMTFAEHGEQESRFRNLDQGYGILRGDDSAVVEFISEWTRFRNGAVTRLALLEELMSTGRSFSEDTGLAAWVDGENTSVFVLDAKDSVASNEALAKAVRRQYPYPGLIALVELDAREDSSSNDQIGRILKRIDRVLRYLILTAWDGEGHIIYRLRDQ